jgi:hypothetical protein
MNSEKPEWYPYRVGKPSTREGWTELDCQPFKTVSHVAHIDDAFRIFEDDEICPSLIFDESKLKTTRTSMTWLSPNTWANGSRYGNVSFEFDWKKLTEEKHFYWVEAIRYGIPAFRILVTDREPVIPLPKYRPKKGDGPLFYDPDQDIWYRNGSYTGEFMFDGALSLDECATVTFVNHHEQYCNKGGCDNKGEEGYKCGARLLSRLMARMLFLPKKNIWFGYFARAGRGTINCTMMLQEHGRTSSVPFLWKKEAPSHGSIRPRS